MGSRTQKCRRQDISLKTFRVFRRWLFSRSLLAPPAMTLLTAVVFWLFPTCRSWKIPPVRISLAGTTSTGKKSPFSFISRIWIHSSRRRVTSLHLQKNKPHQHIWETTEHWFFISYWKASFVSQTKSPRWVCVSTCLVVCVSWPEWCWGPTGQGSCLHLPACVHKPQWRLPLL